MFSLIVARNSHSERERFAKASEQVILRVVLLANISLRNISENILGTGEASWKEDFGIHCRKEESIPKRNYQR